MNPIEELSVWLEESRPTWQKWGVDVLERGSQTIFMGIQPNGQLDGVLFMYVGTVEACARLMLIEAEFIPLIVLGDISVEHSKILIENAVQQVAGR